MSIFGNIASSIFGKKTAGATFGTPGRLAPAPQGTATAGGTPATGKAITQAEVEAMIKKIADGQSEKLDWQRSIVDMMKLLKLYSTQDLPPASSLRRNSATKAVSTARPT